MPGSTLGTLMTSAAADVINHNGRKIGRFKPRRFCRVNMYIISAWIFTRGQFWPSGIVVACVCVCVCVSLCLSVCQSLACPCDNSGPVQARIAKFGPKMQKTLVKVPIVLFFCCCCFFFWGGGGGGGQLTLTFKVKFNFKVRIHPILSLSGP